MRRVPPRTPTDSESPVNVPRLIFGANEATGHGTACHFRYNVETNVPYHLRGLVRIAVWLHELESTILPGAEVARSSDVFGFGRSQILDSFGAEWHGLCVAAVFSAYAWNWHR